MTDSGGGTRRTGPKQGSVLGMFGELSDYRSMISNLVRREIRGRYKGSVLGFLWNFITPLIQIVVYLIVFTVIFDPDLDNYAIYLISGMVIWIWFSESMSEGSGTIVANADMLKKIYFPHVVLPLSTVLSKMVNFLIMVAMFFVILAATGYGVSVYALLFLPVAIGIAFVFISGLTFMLSALNAYLRDVQYIVSVLLMAWIWITPIMYEMKTFGNAFVDTILSLNPMTYFVEMFHDIFYWGVVPGIDTVLMCCALAAALLAVGIAVFRYLEKDFAEVL